MLPSLNSTEPASCTRPSGKRIRLPTAAACGWLSSVSTSGSSQPSSTSASSLSSSSSSPRASRASRLLPPPKPRLTGETQLRAPRTSRWTVCTTASVAPLASTSTSVGMLGGRWRARLERHPRSRPASFCVSTSTETRGSALVCRVIATAAA